MIPPTPKKQDQINPKQIQKNVTVVPPPSRGGNEEKNPERESDSPFVSEGAKRKGLHFEGEAQNVKKDP